MTTACHTRVLALAAVAFLAAGACEAAAAPGGSPGTAPPPEAASCRERPLRATGTAYYFCDCRTGADPACVAGDDASAGTNSSAPRRSLSAAFARFNTMRAGDTVALCRGGAWDESGGEFGSSSCRGASTCDFRDYVPPWGSTSTPRPRMNIGGGTAFIVRGGEGFRIWNLDIRATDSGGNIAIRMWRLVTNVDICNVRIDGPHEGIDLSLCGESVDTHITIRDSQIQNTGFTAIGGGAPGLLVDSSVFQNNGLLSNPQQHTFYVYGCASTSPAKPYMTYRNNDVVTDGRCGGVMMWITGRHWRNGLIENNRFFTTSTNPNCYGIQAAGSASYGEIHDLTVARNRVIHAIAGTGIDISACTECIISDNITVNGHIGVGGAVGGTSGPTTRCTIQNNTIYMASTGSVALGIGAQGDGFIVENNAVWTNGPSCFGISAPTARQGNNYCRSRGGAAVRTVFVDAPNGDFRPAKPGPLVGAANQAHYSPKAIGSVTWSATDRGMARRPPIDIGALQR